MNNEWSSRSVTSRLRRGSPVVLLVAGALFGAMVSSVGREPATDSRRAAVSGGGPSAGTGASTGDIPTDSLTTDGEVATQTPAVGSASAEPGTGAAASADGVGAGTAAASAGCAGSPSKGVRGVTDQKMRVGFAVTDLKAFSLVFGDNVNVGDMRAQVNALLAGFRKDKLLPVCGRDIEPVFREFNLLDPASSRAACTRFIDEDKVFMVSVLFAFGAQDCVAIEKRTILFDLSGSEETLKRTPYLFLMDPPEEVMQRAMATWVAKELAPRFKKVGLYYNSADSDSPEKNIADVLRQHGLNPVVVTSDNTTSDADPNDAVAIQRFRTEGVDLVIPLATVNFFNQARAQNYHPQWATYSTTYASDATTSSHPPETMDGALGLLFEHVGEVKAGIPLSPEMQRCYKYWTDAGGNMPNPDHGQGQVIREHCDQIILMMDAMKAAGNNLTQDSFAVGMETIKNKRMAYYADTSFARGKHYAPDSNVVNEYHQECACWKSTNNWRALFAQ